MTSKPAGETRKIVLLGSTGSIGTQTLDVLDRLREAGIPSEVVGLAAGTNVERLSEQIHRYRPRIVSIGSDEAATRLRKRHRDVEVASGATGLTRLAGLEDADVVVNALVGAAGLAPTLEALDRGKLVALANKESLVIGGELVRRSLRTHGGSLLPIDSEHNALLQCLQAGRRNEVKRLILTASGGPFLDTPQDALDEVTPSEALRHPNWSMGKRITIDSATMVNKGLEVIEAHYLFDLPYEQIDVVVHPESIIHSLVEYHDGSILAELASPDMRIPIQYALTYPERLETALPRLDLARAATLHLDPLEHGRFPAFDTVLAAAEKGGTAPAAVNAADEVLVERFLNGEIGFRGIPLGLRHVLDAWEHVQRPAEAELDLERLLHVDTWARATARGLTNL